MSILPASAEPPDRVKNDPFSLRRFSVSEYHKMIDSGILDPDDRVELLEAWIVFEDVAKPAPQQHGRSRQPHPRSRPAATLDPACAMPRNARATVNWNQTSRWHFGTEGTYDKRHPRPADISILMEVADSSLLEDRRYKGALYAREKIAESWRSNVVPSPLSPRGRGGRGEG